MKKHLLLIFMAATLLLGCKENKNEQPGSPLTLSQTEATLTIGGSQTLTVTAPSEYVSNANIVWTSHNPDVATVDASGKVSAIRPGEAIIYAYVDGLKSVRGECVITVSAAVLKLSKNEAVIGLDQILDLTFKYDVPVAQGWEVTIAASDSVAKIITVTTDPNEMSKEKKEGTPQKPINYDPATGIAKLSLKGIRPGVVNVIVKNKLAPQVSFDTIKVIVEPAAITDFTLNYADGTKVAINSTDSVLKVTAFTPAEFKGIPVEFKSLNPELIDVDAKGNLIPNNKANINADAQLNMAIIRVRTMFSAAPIEKTVTLELTQAGKVNGIFFTEKTDTVYAVIDAVNGLFIPVKAEVGDNYSVNVVAQYQPEDNKKASITATAAVDRGGVTVFAPFAACGTGTAKIALVSSLQDKDGKPITDTCLVIVNQFNKTSAKLYTNTVYNPVNFDKDVAIKAKVVSMTQLSYTINSIKLVAPKGSVYNSKKLTTDEVIEEIPGAAVSSGVTQEFAFKPLPSKVNNLAEFKAFEVRYTITSASGFLYEVSDLANILDNGSAYAPKL